MIRDGLDQSVSYFRTYLKEINLGGYWADKSWKNVDHYYVPETGKGIWPFGNALDTFGIYYEWATKEIRTGNFRKAAFFLGAAAHLVQDLCVPHHARGQMFNGHKEYESWARQNMSDFAVGDDGYYLRGDQKVSELLTDNAAVASFLLDLVDPKKPNADFQGVTSITLPLAQRSTAGLFEHFYRQILRLDAPLFAAAQII
jgi:phospholipase C